MKIVILTGAGISAESGIETFRADTGLWANHRVEDVATPEGFAKNPDLVQSFYNGRRAQLADGGPNDAHKALVELEKHADVLVVTQNVDDLHERAGQRNIIHMHGALLGALCHLCDHRWDAPTVMHASDTCPACGAAKTRPDIVWFGEMPYQMDRIIDAIHDADLFVSIGTSGNVYPAAGFAAEAERAGVDTLELNLEPSNTPTNFADAQYGPATKIVPAWVATFT
jgi:NAD-dependent deacetylase